MGGTTDSTEMLFGKNSVVTTFVTVSNQDLTVTVYVKLSPTFGWNLRPFLHERSAYLGVSVFANVVQWIRIMLIDLGNFGYVCMWLWHRIVWCINIGFDC